ncbi:glycosyltransferase [bacterium]|nr:glycosyltransferase [bacterium]
MRIGIEAQRIFRPHKHGMDIVALEVLRELQQLPSEHEFVVFVKDDEDHTCLTDSANMQIVKVPGKTYVDWEQIALPKAAKKAGIDLLHCTSNTAPVGVKWPLVITLHDIIYLEKLAFTGTAYQNFGNVYRRFNVPAVVRKAQKIITVSAYEQARIVAKLQLPADKVKVVYNGLNDKFKTYDNEALNEFRKQQPNLPSNFILSLGNQAPKKNMKGSIKAYLQYRTQCEQPLPLVLVECTEAFLTDTLKEFGALGDREHFVLTGYLPHAQLPLLYNLCSFYIYPSFRESFGIPILEAQACGVPVITSNTSSMPEVAGGAARLINPEKIQEMAAAMTELTNNKDERDKLVALGFENARKFTWRNTALQTLEVYNEILQ